MPALIALLKGSERERVFAWQGSNMTLTRIEHTLRLEDVGELAKACELNHFDLYDFVKAMVEVTKTLVLLVDQIQRNIRTRKRELDPAEDRLTIACLERLAEQLSDRWRGYVEEIERLLLARKPASARQVSGPRYLLPGSDVGIDIDR